MFYEPTEEDFKELEAYFETRQAEEEAEFLSWLDEQGEGF